MAEVGNPVSLFVKEESGGCNASPQNHADLRHLDETRPRSQTCSIRIASQFRVEMRTKQAD